MLGFWFWPTKKYIRKKNQARIVIESLPRREVTNTLKLEGELSPYCVGLLKLCCPFPSANSPQTSSTVSPATFCEPCPHCDQNLYQIMLFSSPQHFKKEHIKKLKIFFAKSFKRDDSYCRLMRPKHWESSLVLLVPSAVKSRRFSVSLAPLLVYICLIVLVKVKAVCTRTHGRSSCILSLFVATPTESCSTVCWESIGLARLCVQHSAGGGREVAGSGVKVSGWTTEATTRKPPDFYPTTKAEQEIGRRPAGESILEE